jgi:hypothetical protein
VARKRSFISLVAQFVPLKLWYPEVETGFWQPRERAPGVPMPEAAMNKNNLAPWSEDEIGTAWQLPLMKPVAIAEREHKLPNTQFRARVLGANARHDLRSFLRSE